MKRIPKFLLILWVVAYTSHLYAASHTCGNSPVTSADSIDDNRFAGRSEEQFKTYVDSIISALYPAVREDSSQIARSITSTTPVTRGNPTPHTVSLDQTCAVGEIPIKSGLSPTGARTYDVPLDIYSGVRGFQPQLSISYNSQQGNGVMGVGWSLSGLSAISRVHKAKYYDGKSSGIQLNALDDALVLDGMHLIYLSTSGNARIYETETGNIKVKGYFSGGVLKYFEVFYPDGNKGTFGYPSITTNLLSYPLTSLTDLYGNTIVYTYTFSNNHYSIKKIEYSGSSVEFTYNYNRTDDVEAYSAGLNISETSLLDGIICKIDSTELGRYTLTYSSHRNKSVLSQIGYSAGNKTLNPLRFFYGEGATAEYYRADSTQLEHWHSFEDPGHIRLGMGKFGVNTSVDGLMTFPSYNPYFEFQEAWSVGNHSKDYLVNTYDVYSPNGKIFLHAGLNQDYAGDLPHILLENGFIDVFSADLDGTPEECVVKVNNRILNGNDRILFSVYKTVPQSGFTLRYFHHFDFSTIHTDASGNKSIQPKNYYAGDFNGDGRQDVLAVSFHLPFGDTNLTSRCYIFDIPRNQKIFDAHVMNFHQELIGSYQTDLDYVANNSDKLIVLDFDGDGKSDICHIHASGTDIYTFDVTGTSLTSRLVCSSSTPTLSMVANRDILIGDINCDGLADLYISPTPAASSTQWSIYRSKGNGSFALSIQTGPTKSNNEHTGFLSQDINGDGAYDLIKYDSLGFTTYLTSNNTIGNTGTYTTYPYSGSAICASDMNAYNRSTKLISIKNGKVVKYSYLLNENRELLATGMANSLGVVETNDYDLMTDDNLPRQSYLLGDDAVFPYYNLNANIPLLASSVLYFNGSMTDKHNYTYDNAKTHRQGLGLFCFNYIRDEDWRLRQKVQYFDHTKYGTLWKEVTPEHRVEYSLNIDSVNGRIFHLLRTQEQMWDYLKNTSWTTSYTYNNYGHPTQESTPYPGGITVTTNYSYSSHPTVSDGYYIDFLTDKKVRTTQNGQSFEERTQIPAYSRCSPTVEIHYKNSNRIKQINYSYDSSGNTTAVTERHFTSTNNLTTQYSYDSHGRQTHKTDPMGLTEDFTYDAKGQLAARTDHRGGVTNYLYDELGREKSVTNPDNTVKNTTYSWSLNNGTNSLYSIKEQSTGRPIVFTVYDAFHREVRKRDQRFNGSYRYKDKLYDVYGRLQKESYPFRGSPTSNWNTFEYDVYDRIVSALDASGREVTTNYNGNSVTTTADGITSTKTYDVLGRLVSVTDPAGTITYNLAPDGQPTSIVAPGNVTTTFSYDQYRRRTSIVDPSAGTTSYVYDAAGNISQETNANGQTISNTYDNYNRLATTVRPEFTTTYTYNSLNDLVAVTSTNGTSKAMTYDTYGRLTTSIEYADEDVWLRKDYTYSSGNISSITYTTQNGTLATENYNYTYGHLKSGKINGTTAIFSLSTENGMGLLTQFRSGDVLRKYTYSTYGLPTSRKATNSSQSITYQHFSYTFDPLTRNLLSRTDNKYSLTETFTYDGLNRLTGYGTETASYDSKGNILEKSDVGTFYYDTSGKPYAISEANPCETSAISSLPQLINYTSFHRPASITEEYQANFTYNVDYDRVKMTTSHYGSFSSARYYLGGNYEMEDNGSWVTERLYLFGDYYNAPVVLIKEDGDTEVYSILRDYLGSITQVVSSDGTICNELSYDAWGRLREPSTGDVYDWDEQPYLLLGRGYTGHEHLREFGLINMNARLYDPALGRFLSPDPYVQAPDFTQNFNRYSYGLNNPLKYVDENGEFILSSLLIGFGIGALIGATSYSIGTWITGQDWNWGNFGKAVGMGAFSGTFAAGASLLAGSALLGSFGNTLGYNFLSSMTNSVTTNALFGGDLSWKNLISISTAAFIGAQIPTFGGVKGGWLSNAVGELGHNAMKGAVTGLASGAVDAGTHNDLNYLWKDIVGNTISAVGRTLAVDAILGSPHILEIEEGKKAMFRTGGLSSLFSGKGSGLTLGRMAYVQSLNNSTKYHEFYHMQDINRMGWANFYARTLHEYFKYGFPKVYEIKNTLEWNADQYMDYRIKNPL